MTIHEIWNAVDGFLIRGIFVSIGVILLAKILFKNKIDQEASLRMVRMIFVIHCVVYLAALMIFLLFDLESPFLTRLRGPYWWAYGSMIFFNSLLPLTVLFRRLGNKVWYLVLLAFLMNIGWIMESLVIRTTATSVNAMDPDYNPYLPTSFEITVLIHGVALGLLLVLIPNLHRRINIKNR